MTRRLEDIFQLWRRTKRWWRREVMGSIDHAAVVSAIDEEADWSLRYLFMVLMSAGIAILGLLQSSPAVVIGAMLISPLMGPIIGLGFALAIFDWREVRMSLASLGIGSLVAVAITAMIVLASPLQGVTPEILARTRPNLFDLLIAIFSALAGTYATIKGRGATVVGVAIATALMPPLAVVGYGLATLNMAIFGGALALYLTNFIAIALTAALMARLYGFAQTLSPDQTRVQSILIPVVFLVLSVPLAFSLRQIATEAVATARLRSAITAEFSKGARISQLEIRFEADPPTATAVVVDRQFRREAEARIAAAWANIVGEAAPFNLNQLVANQDLPRIEQERSALAAARQRAAGETATADTLLDAVSLATGTPVGDIVIDREGHRMLATARPGVSLATLYATETRLTGRYKEWQLRLVPPVNTPLRVRFAAGSANLDQTAMADLVQVRWALERWHIGRVAAIGRAASNGDGAATLAEVRAVAVAKVLTENGFVVTARGDSAGPLQRAAEQAGGVEAFQSVVIDVNG